MAAFAALAALSAAMWFFYFPLLADDAYIGARYVHQLYAGHGLVFNAGERINALTSPLHTLVLAAIQPFFADAVTAYRLLALLLTAAGLVLIAGKAYARISERLLFLAMTLGSPLIAFWTVGGLETPILLCICSCIALLALSARDGEHFPRPASLIALCALAVATRYDSVLFVAPLAALCLWHERHNGRVVAAAAIAAFALVAWVVFTQLYYGDILPTSFYVKSPLKPATGELGRGLLYLASFVILCVAPIFFVWPARLPTDRESPGARYIVALGLGLLAEAAYGVFAGTKHMMYAYRLFVPYLPSVVLLALARAPRGTRHVGALRGVGIFALVAYQGLLAVTLYFLSQNPNLSLLFRRQALGDENYEFSTFGAKSTGDFLAAVRASAQDVKDHWRGVPDAGRAPRLLVMTGGSLPYLLPDTYVLELLVSYRHHCKPELYPLADYMQVVHKDHELVQLPGDPATEQWTLVSSHAFTARGLEKDPVPGVVEIWFRRNHSPLTLPPDINGACVSARRDAP